MKNIFRRAFEYSASERKSIVLLIILIGILVLIQSYLAFHPADANAEKQELFESEIAGLQKDQKQAPADDRNNKDTVMVYEHFMFDPNTSDAGRLKRLGFSNRQIRNILAYRLKGGSFKKKEDLKKIYGMNDETYNRISAYIRIAEFSKPDPIANLIEKPVAPQRIDINCADTNILMRIHGIGPVLSSRIIRYRSLLGGFYSMEQLSEVYGLNDTVLQLLKRDFCADTTLIIKLNVNKALITELMRHPYIGKSCARGIIRYRTTVSEIKNINELKINGLIDKEQFEKARKYLTI